MIVMGRGVMTHYYQKVFAFTLIGLLAVGGVWNFFLRTDDQNTTSGAKTLEISEVLIGTVGMTPEYNRVVIALENEQTRMRDIKSVNLIVRNPDTGADVWQGDLTRYQDYAGDYWVGYPDFPEARIWEFVLTVTPNDRTYQPRTFTRRWEVMEQTVGLLVNEPAPASDTPTWHSAADGEISAITSDLTPRTEYYEMSVAEAVTSGEPSLIIFSTPELCTRQICASTLESMDPLFDLYPDLNIVHVEVYNLSTGEKVPALEEWRVKDTKWPWIFVVDSWGMVRARYDGLLSVEEVRPMLDLVLAE